MLPVLEGHIRYTLHFFSSTIQNGDATATEAMTTRQYGSVVGVHVDVGRKRKAVEITNVPSNNTVSCTSVAADNNAHGFPSWAGWSFTHQVDSTTKAAAAAAAATAMTKTCLAILPEGAVALVSRANERNVRVRIHRYKYRSIEWASSNENRTFITAIDIHENGLSLEPLSFLNHQTLLQSSSVLTLAQLAKLEYLEVEVWNKNSRKCSIMGHVEAVSPIITVDPKDPFCLVELRQPTKHANYSLVVVLRKESLIRWPTIQPGSHVTFYDTTRQAWGVPKWLAPWRPHRIPPSRVLVVERPTQIILSTTEEVMSPENPCIHGKIVDVRLLRLSKKHTAIQFVQLDSSVYIFMAYFPMDSTLRSSLQVGAEIKAFSLYCLEQDNVYEATIRSSIVVTKLSSFALETPTTRDLKVTLPCIPFYFVRKIKIPCLELWHRLQIRNWLDGVLGRAEDDDDDDDECASDDLVDSVYRYLYHSKIPPTSTTHNPYANFFECQESKHETSMDGRSKYDIVDSKVEDDSSSPEAGDEKMPKLFTLDFLREWAMSQVRHRLVQCQKTTNLISPGWIGSVILELTEIEPHASVYAGGTIKESPTRHEKLSKCVSLKNGKFYVPVALDQEISQPPGSFVLVKLKSVVASSVCLCRAAESTETCGLDLPKYDSGGFESSVGCSRILVLGGMTFLCCVVFRGDNAMLFEPKQVLVRPTNPQTRNVCTRFQTIEECLCPPSVVEPPGDQAVSSLLIRKSIRFCKARHGKFNGICLTLANFSQSDFGVEEAVSSIQSIEMRPVIKIDNSKRWTMKQSLEQGFIHCCSPELMDTATVLWKLADDTLHCPIIMGGWDEIATANISDIASSCGVQVVFPAVSTERDLKRGYVRFRCSLDDIQSSFVSIRSERNAGFSGGMSLFDFGGGEKFFPGMLDRRPSRVGQRTLPGEENPFGPLNRCPRAPSAGIVASSLAALHTYTCLDLQRMSRISLAPSLVREIRGRFLGISFCEVFPECTKCFHKLVRLKRTPNQNGMATYDNSNKAPGYWHQPVRHRDTVQHEAIHVRKTNDPLPRHRTYLSCRNGCEPKNFALRWECSGTLDDGTGQAKLYAEREVALTLLGMDKRTIDTIEDGVWNLEGGLIFCRSIPVKPLIRTLVEMAKSLAVSEIKNRRKIHSLQLEEEIVLRYMNPAGRAEYLLHEHCRKSMRPLRPLVYYVRCKPLSDEVRMVNHTELSLVTESEKRPECGLVQAAPRRTISYALPPLKLNLVDTAIPE